MGVTANPTLGAAADGLVRCLGGNEAQPDSQKLFECVIYLINIDPEMLLLLIESRISFSNLSRTCCTTSLIIPSHAARELVEMLQ